METMKVEMLDTVEDTNASMTDKDGKQTITHATDRLPKGSKPTLPAPQARNLIRLGYARAL